MKGDSWRGGQGLSLDFPLVTHTLSLDLHSCLGAAEGAHS